MVRPKQIIVLFRLTARKKSGSGFCLFQSVFFGPGQSDIAGRLSNCPPYFQKYGGQDCMTFKSRKNHIQRSLVFRVVIPDVYVQFCEVRMRRSVNKFSANENIVIDFFYRFRMPKKFRSALKNYGRSGNPKQNFF